LITPFDKNGDIDYVALKELLRRQINLGTEGIVLLGSTAEAPMLKDYEKTQIMKCAESEIGGRVPIIAGINAFSLEEALIQVQNRGAEGADYLLVSPPPYIKPTYDGLESYFSKIAKSSKIPVILYNIPSRTGVNIPFELVKDLSKNSNIIGIKEASGDMNYIQKLSSLANDDFSIICGNDNLLLPMLSVGATAIISVVGNLTPELCSNIIYNYLNGNKESAQNLYLKYLELFNLLGIESNPIPIKFALHKLGLIENKYREPLCEPTKEHKDLIENFVKK